MAETGHTPVLLQEALAALSPRAGGVYLDGTYGRGGYTRAILESASCQVWAIDRDPQAVAAAAPMVAEFNGRLSVLQGRFGDMKTLLAARGVTALDGIVLDVGVSGPQLDDAARGFSFRLDGPLDMRMEQAGADAASLVNGLEEDALVRLFRDLGEEPRARRIARAIVAARQVRPFRTTAELAEAVHGAVPRNGKATDPATRVFQALRIHVNDELGELDRALAAAEDLLRPGGRLVVVAFHSLEDRRVKQFIRGRAGGEGVNRHMPETALAPPPLFRALTRGAVKAGAAELARNRRARSARLRAAERLPDGSAAGGMS